MQTVNHQQRLFSNFVAAVKPKTWRFSQQIEHKRCYSTISNSCALSYMFVLSTKKIKTHQRLKYWLL